MLQMTTRAALATAGGAAAIVLTNTYYAQTVECLARIEKVAHAAIPAILAVALVYHVVQTSLGRKP